MAQLLDMDKSTEIGFELNLFPTKYPEDIQTEVVFKLPRIKFLFKRKTWSSEIDEIKFLITKLRELIDNKIDMVEFYPLEPDFRIDIKHSGKGKYEKENLYFFRCYINTWGNDGVLYEKGVSLDFDVDREILTKFTEELEIGLKRIITKQPPKKT